MSEKEKLTGFFNAFRRKNDLQLSQEITSKLNPLAGESQIAQRSVVFALAFVVGVVGVVVSFGFAGVARISSSNVSISIDLHNAILLLR